MQNYKGKKLMRMYRVPIQKKTTIAYCSSNNTFSIDMALLKYCFSIGLHYKTILRKYVFRSSEIFNIMI